MDTEDKIILDLIQRGFPLTVRPFQEIAKQAMITEREAFERIEGMKKEKIIRRIGGIFDSEKLGYVSTLCAAKIPQDRIDSLTEFIRPITEITHNYQRRHEYNIWFTVIAATDERLDEIIGRVRAFLGSGEVYSLPAVRKFKVSVFFNMMEAQEEPAEQRTKSRVCDGEALYLTAEKRPVFRDEEKALIRLLQENLPSEMEPFHVWAEKLEIEAQELIHRIEQLCRFGAMKRFGSILYHQKAGFGANAMGVWRVAEDNVEEIGGLMASSSKVSHCYSRTPIPGFGYNLYTMVHGRSDEECRRIMEELAALNGITDYDMLYSVRELKKSSMKYFVEE